MPWDWTQAGMIELKFHVVFFSLLVTGICKLHRCTDFDEYSAPKLATLHVLRSRQKCKVFNHTPTQRNVFSSNTAKEYWTAWATCKISVEESCSFYKLSCLDCTRWNNFYSEHISAGKRFRAKIGGFLTPKGKEHTYLLNILSIIRVQDTQNSLSVTSWRNVARYVVSKSINTRHRRFEEIRPISFCLWLKVESYWSK
jgi:hypothetical protein